MGQFSEGDYPAERGAEAVRPRTFASSQASDSDVYLSDPAIQKLVEFFQAKGLLAIKEEDRRESWYSDWLTYQAAHKLYASLLSPARFSTIGASFDVLKLVRFLEVFAYFSPAHGYSLQVTFLGLSAILAGENETLKKQAVAILEAGGLLAFGVSEKHHGSDLFGNEFTAKLIGADRYVANGSKYYIGNSQIASMIAVLARMEDAGTNRRSPFALFALQPIGSQHVTQVKKIRTSGVRAAYVGEFNVKNYEFGTGDMIAEGRGAWNAVFSAVTMGKFFLGFGSIGICEHALAEAIDHLTMRKLYGNRVIDLPHIRALATQAYARLSAMKLYAYRALDYLHAASPTERRYELFNAVQKAKVTTEGVKVIALLSECMGAKGFEVDTFIEMARRDAQLIPAVEGSTHVNLALAAQFLPRYFAHEGKELPEPPSLIAGEVESQENVHLMQAHAGSIHSITFGYFLEAYRPLMSVANVRLFAQQAKRFALFVHHDQAKRFLKPGSETALAFGQFLAMFAYGQAIAENCARCHIPLQNVSAVFHGLVEDISILALSMASPAQLQERERKMMSRLLVAPRTSKADWDWVADQMGR